MKKTKIALSVLLSLLMVLSCASAAFADGEVSATAEAKGLEETVTVTVTVNDGVITDVAAETDKAEATVGAQAIEKLPAAMVESNSVKVDAISGATATSNAVLAAAADAYLQILGAACITTGDSRLELRTEIAVTGMIFSQMHCTYVADLSAQPAAETESAPAALTLYFPEVGEPLWEIARRYRTTVEAIRAENQLEGERVEEKTVLLEQGSAYHEPALVGLAYPVFQGALVVAEGAEATIRTFVPSSLSSQAKAMCPRATEKVNTAPSRNRSRTAASEVTSFSCVRKP